MREVGDIVEIAVVRADWDIMDIQVWGEIGQA